MDISSEPPLALPAIAGTAVVLRAFSADDAPLITSASRHALIPLLTSVPRAAGHGDALAYIGRQHTCLVERTGFSFAIADAASGTAVGQIGLSLRDAALGRASISYWVGPGFQHRGYAGAALEALTRWILGTPLINRVELYIEPWNDASLRTAERCGYRREGLLRQWQRVGGTRRDMYMYSRLDSDPIPEESECLPKRAAGSSEAAGQDAGLARGV